MQQDYRSPTATQLADFLRLHTNSPAASSVSGQHGFWAISSMSSQSGWQSLAGYLQMKLIGGALNILRSKKRYYFVLDEGVPALLYFKSESDFITKRSPGGSIPLTNCTVTVSDSNPEVFILHLACKQIELEADNDKSATVWINCLRRVLGHGDSAGCGLTRNLSDQALKPNVSSLSLPSDTEMANMLDVAFKSSMTSSAHADIAHTVDPSTPYAASSLKREARFYFDSAGGAGSRVSSDEDEHQEAMHNGRDVRSKHAAESLQQWIRNCLQPDSGLTSMTDSDDANLTDVERELHNVKRQLQGAKVRELCWKTKLAEQETMVKQLAVLLKTNKSPLDAATVKMELLKSQNKLLNVEVMKLANQCSAMDDNDSKAQRIQELEAELERYKREYVYLLQSCIRIPLSERTGLVEVRLYGGNAHFERVKVLIEEARAVDPTLPAFEAVATGAAHMDVYGFQQMFTDEGLMLHYLCTQLHQHYQRSKHQENKMKWKAYLKTHNGMIVNTKETRQLVRAGIPPTFRGAIWRRLIHQQVADVRAQHGKYYYKNLISTVSGGPNEKAVQYHKQITLDLLRTMPTNMHFSSPDCKGVTQIQEVLMAYCHHNPELGYCQGMNFIVGTALLFLTAEDAFWLLVAITEKYFISSYFDSALVGAQADQEILKELVDEKLPRLATHLEQCDIDLATITLNWFLALYFDCLPFETMLRIWDCFLLEGPKVIFRFALGLLSLHEAATMERCDTISVMKILKAVCKYSYDADGLVKRAFSGLKPFPKRGILAKKQAAYLHILKERLKMKEELKRAWGWESTVFSSGPATPTKLRIQLATFCSSGVYIMCGSQFCAKLAFVDCQTSVMSQLQSFQLDSRALAFVVIESHAFISQISGALTAVNLKDLSILWEFRLQDVALSLCCNDGTLYAGLANGTLAVIENPTSKIQSLSDVYYIPLGPAPVSCLSAYRDYLWCAVASKAVLLNLTTLDVLDELCLAATVSGGNVSFFERVLCFAPSQYGIWICLQKSPLVQLWDPTSYTATLLYDITTDHFNVTFKENENIQITCLLVHESTVWVGTVDGYLIIYEVRRKTGGILNSKRSPGASNYTLSSLASPGNLLGSPRSHSVASGPSAKKYSSTVSQVGLEDSGVGMSQSGSEHDSAKKLGKQENLEKFLKSLSEHNKQRESAVFRAPLSVSKADVSGQKDNDITPLARPKSLSVCEPMLHGLLRTESPITQPEEKVVGTDAASINGGSTRSGSSESRIQRKYSKNVKGRQRHGSAKVFQRTKSSTSLADSERRGSLVSSGSWVSSYRTSDGYEYDDYMVPYPDDSDAGWTRPQGGLASLQLARSDSAWSLQEPENFSALDQDLQNVKLLGRSFEIDNFEMDLGDVKLRRRDLEVDEFFRISPRPKNTSVSQCDVVSDYESENCFAASETASVISMISHVEAPFLYDLGLQMMLKISDKPVNCLTATKHKDQDVIISCAGNYEDDEAVLRWTKADKDHSLWTNDPVIEQCKLAAMKKVSNGRLRAPRPL